MITLIPIFEQQNYNSSREADASDEFLKNASDLEVDLDRLILVNTSVNHDLTQKRIEDCSVLIRILGDDEFKAFYSQLDDSQKQKLLNLEPEIERTSNGISSIERLSNPENNLNIDDQKLQEELCSYLAIKKAKTPEEIRKLITNPDFLKSVSFKINELEYTIFQSFLMHNPEGIEALKNLTNLTPEQDEKKNVILKNVVISSLINPNLQDKAKEILNLEVVEFDDRDRQGIKNSLTFLSVQIKKSIAENQDDKLLKQFDVLAKALEFYGNKLDIAIELPVNILEATEEKLKLELALPDSSKKYIKEISEPNNLAKDVLSGDNRKKIIELSVLSTLVKGSSASPLSNSSSRAR
jgi:hypothetical protein